MGSKAMFFWAIATFLRVDLWLRLKNAAIGPSYLIFLENLFFLFSLNYGRIYKMQL